MATTTQIPSPTIEQNPGLLRSGWTRTVSAFRRLINAVEGLGIEP
ncbi:MAG: hypothetical protein QF554_11790 [Dehalococcoidia bacterium]|jgi:hypothetical protein|nr:hypothetical protein [Dehalococcoidia bacterium]